MGLQTPSGEDLLYALTFAIVCGLALAAVWAVYSLGSLPGRIARSRRHPKATAIGTCGWLGLPLFPLWPVALAWAYTTPRARPRRAPTGKVRHWSEDEHLALDAPAADLGETEMAALAAGLRATSEKIAALESRMGIQASKKVA